MLEDRVQIDRRRIEDIRREADQVWQGVPQAAEAVVVQTATKDTYPTEINAYFYCEVISLRGEPTEGEAVEYAGVGQFLYAANVGSQLPEPGTRHIATLTNGRWSFKHGC